MHHCEYIMVLMICIYIYILHYTYIYILLVSALIITSVIMKFLISNNRFFFLNIHLQGGKERPGLGGESALWGCIIPSLETERALHVYNLPFFFAHPVYGRNFWRFRPKPTVRFLWAFYLGNYDSHKLETWTKRCALFYIATYQTFEAIDQI